MRMRHRQRDTEAQTERHDTESKDGERERGNSETDA